MKDEQMIRNKPRKTIVICLLYHNTLRLLACKDSPKTYFQYFNIDLFKERIGTAKEQICREKLLYNKSYFEASSMPVDQEKFTVNSRNLKVDISK